MESQILKGEKYLYGVIVTIVLLQVVTNISDSTPLLFSLTRLPLLFILFYFLLKGYSWSKWLLLVYLLSVGLGGIGAGWYLITNRGVLPENMYMGIIDGFIGIIYITSMIVLQFSKEIKIYLAYQKTNRNKITVRNYFSSILFYVGIAVIICIETTMIPIAAKNVLKNPNLLKKIFGVILLLPVKVPYYAIPGLVILLISRLISKDD